MKTIKLFFTSLMLLASSGIFSQNPADRDTTFNMHVPIAVGQFSGATLYKNIAIQPDGKIIYVGGFYHYGSSYSGIMRLNTDGTYDNTFNASGAGANAIVAAVAIQSDGKILIGGSFTQYNGISRPNIARLNANGSLDTTFVVGTGAPSIYAPSVRSIVVQPDGKILIAGSFTNYNGTAIAGIARLNADGTLDNTFNPGTGPSHIIEVIKLLPSGKIVVGGRFGSFNGVNNEGVTLLNSDGSSDASFSCDVQVSGTSPVYDIEVQSDGKLVVVGAFNKYGSNANGSNNGIIRLNTDGSVDNSFTVGTAATTGSSNGSGFVYAVDIQNDGKIIIVGNFDKYNLVDRGGVARLNSDGTLDSSFDSNPGFDGSAYDVVVNSSTQHIYLANGGGNYQGEDLFNYHTQFSGHNRDIIRLFGDAGPTSIKDNKKIENIVVYPNPFTSSLTISNESINKIKAINVFNQLGEQVSIKQNDTNTINTNNLKSGIYFIQVLFEDNSVISQKIIKQ